ncbi:hypothetical protein P9G84_31410 [Brevibacillus centrosporus]|uniref:hypothetical protein n=1 Tax=Brevibacillus centrosporus TaxID=54910 RepID=UPI000F09E6D6|nr:hypothetical protein [Brevibacillus centrosporus]MEC2133366.1 hypothetical protein [Brevibacillus centrosporus]RNB68618.1 hypothetical protein EDM55_17015 [Brevibacillus centrosporus]GED35041.1 hypothetical protein BCE02nite_61820 [Brevibacillus centrosporus]
MSRSTEEIMLEWLYWHHAVEYMKQDIPKVESAELRFPFFAGWVLRQIGSQAYAKEQEAAKELRENKIRILKEKLDQGELFVIWSYRGNSDIFRIHERKLRTEVQKRIDELMMKVTKS